MTDRTARYQETARPASSRRRPSSTLLTELQQASADHFGADPETVLWGQAAWLTDVTAKLKEIAAHHFRRGEYAL